ncbi:hypothetical protein L596_019765 [Steinernema carpocapsae]|uniref:Uncharacterized protein n=1 Tax=Steinernema carpocapsae TaxID=34508 RepID=A0A4U5MSC8_STECR|nr:hypothetical protein L596_019765 [Steinernema carpocapsae]
MFDEDPEDGHHLSPKKAGQKRPSSLGNSVILFAQQLIGSSDAETDLEKAFYFPPEQANVSYRTRQEGIRPLPETPSESDLNSMAPGRTEDLKGMLRSRSRRSRKVVTILRRRVAKRSLNCARYAFLRVAAVHR